MVTLSLSTSKCSILVMEFLQTLIEVYQSTIRTVDCAILADLPLCNKCKEFSPVLCTSYSHWLRRLGKENISKYTNNRYLTSIQKDIKLKKLLQDQVSTAIKERISSSKGLSR